MKLILDETKFAPSRLQKDYNKHVAKDYKTYLTDTTGEFFDPISPEEYDEDGDMLSKRAVRTSDINSPDRFIGFTMQDGRVLKYDKENKEVVIYMAGRRPANTISYYKVNSEDVNHNRYRRLYNRHYFREVEPRDDYYNR